MNIIYSTKPCASLQTIKVTFIENRTFVKTKFVTQTFLYINYILHRISTTTLTDDGDATHKSGVEEKKKKAFILSVTK